MMYRIALLCVLALVAAPAMAADPAKTPPLTARTVDTNVLTIFGTGSKGDASAFTVIPNAAAPTNSLARLTNDIAFPDRLRQTFSNFQTNARFTNPETDTAIGPGFTITNPSVPFMFTTYLTEPGHDHPDGTVFVGKSADYTSATGPSGYFAGAFNAYTLHKGDTRNNEAGVVGQTMTWNTKNGQPYGQASSVGVIGQDVCQVAGCIAGWGVLGNSVDKSGQINPTQLHYGGEFGHFAVGPDDNLVRIGVLIAMHPAGPPQAAAAVMGRGIQFAAAYGSSFHTGIDFVPGGQFIGSAIHLSSINQQEIGWRNVADKLSKGAEPAAGSKIFKAPNDNQYFDNYESLASNAIGFIFRGSFGGYARDLLTINNNGLTLGAGGLRLGAAGQQEVAWTNVAGAYGAAAGTRFFKAVDDWNYFDNYESTAANTVGFSFRGTFGGAARELATINGKGVRVNVGQFIAPNGAALLSLNSVNANDGVPVTTYVRTVQPTSSDIQPGYCVDWRNSSTGDFRRWCNVAGTLRSVTYQ